MAELRILTERGTEQFRRYLQDLRAGRQATPPTELLSQGDTSEPLDAGVHMVSDAFTTRFKAGEYLEDVLRRLDRRHVDHNPGLWNWLSLHYFELLCPAQPDGTRKPGRDYRYILPPVEDGEHFRHYYRHLLAGAYTIHRLHPGRARILLCGSIDKFDDFNEQLASRQEFVSNPGIIDAADILYFDAASGKPKRGAAPNKRNPGTLRRFVDVIQQFDLTYDLYSLTGRQIIELLPGEFARWTRRE